MNGPLLETKSGPPRVPALPGTCRVARNQIFFLYLSPVLLRWECEMPMNNARAVRYRRLALNEVDRLALYWSKRAIQSLRNDRRTDVLSLSKKQSLAQAEILEGGCLLYRIFNAAPRRDLTNRVLLEP